MILAKSFISTAATRKKLCLRDILLLGIALMLIQVLFTSNIETKMKGQKNYHFCFPVLVLFRRKGKFLCGCFMIKSGACPNFEKFWVFYMFPLNLIASSLFCLLAGLICTDICTNYGLFVQSICTNKSLFVQSVCTNKSLIVQSLIYFVSSCKLSQLLQ